MKVKKITASVNDAQAVPQVLDNEGVSFQKIDIVNWKEYPYHPEAAFRIAHTADSILIHYKVSIPAGDGVYYNMECSCIGTFLVGAGAERNNREHAPREVMEKVSRWSSLGRTPFEERIGECTWEVALVIPYTVFFKHRITSLDGQTIKANFYKCGDELQTPHFLSWNPINIEKPDFHRPDFFGSLEFE